MAARPLALPDTFTGEGRQRFSDWIDHFESIATVNEWNDGAKKNWIRVRLTGRAATAWKRLADTETDTYEHTVAALKRRFEPACRKEVFMAEFQRQSKQRTEDWASFGEDLRALVERAYPTLQYEAQELLALNRFLDEIKDPQLAFGVRQRAPINLDQAVAATLELETYLLRTVTPMAVAGVNSTLDTSIAAATSRPSIESSLQKLMERLEKIEGRLATEDDSDQARTAIARRQELPRAWTEPKNQEMLQLWSRRTLCERLPQQGPGKRATSAALSQATESRMQEAQDNTSNCRKQAQESLNAIPTLIQPGTSTSSFLLQIEANGMDASCLIDTGAAVSLISHGLWRKLQGEDTQLTLYKTDHELVGVQGAPLKLLGECCIEVAFNGLDRTISTPVLVAEMVTSDVILGRDFLRRNRCTVEMGSTDQLHFTNDRSIGVGTMGAMGALAPTC